MADQLRAEELEAFRHVREILLDVIRQLEAGDLDSNMIDALHFRLDWLHGLIIRYFDVYEIGEEVVHLMGTTRDRICNHPQPSESPSPTRIFLGDRGRPRYLIPREQLEFLLERCFSVVDIASLLGARVSIRTIEQRLSEFGLRIRSTYSAQATRHLITLVNPAGVLLRALEIQIIHRRRYQVYGPLALWDMDGNHKLIW